MKLEASDPDIQTLVSRIKAEELDLQPNFQRGEVWSDLKKQRLIDSILRGWHVPPIHLILLDDGTQEVLDGQQRLTSIRDFEAGKLRINGNLEPKDDALILLDGKRYTDLPLDLKRRFDRFAIRVFLLHDYSPDEPAELFFRLNQPTSLTSAEQRNAYMGPTRHQVKELVEVLEASLPRLGIGFVNSRMAFDDVIARVCLTIQNGTTGIKITAHALNEAYRRKQPFSMEAVEACRDAIKSLCVAIDSIPYQVRFNKATLQSWLTFLVALRASSSKAAPAELTSFLSYFTQLHSMATEGSAFLPHKFVFDGTVLDGLTQVELMSTYIDRSTARVADTSSVQIRDAVIWILFAGHVGPTLSQEFVPHGKFAELQRVLTPERGQKSLQTGTWVDEMNWVGWGAMR